MSDAPLYLSTLKFRGANLDLIYNHDHECILVAGADTGKTYAACYKTALMAMNVDGIHAAIVRRTYGSLKSSALRTFERVIAGVPVRKYGGESPEAYIFPNGSKVITIGMDVLGAEQRILSAEFDFVQVCQAEELAESQWELIASRSTGRGAKVKFPQVFADCNPSGRNHWIPKRAQEGALTMLNGSHLDNPELYDDAGQLTEEGKRRLGFLERTLTGVRRQRLLLHKWSTAEGVVYDTFSRERHVFVRQPQEMKRWFLTVDVGYTNPAVILLVGEDGDGRLHCFREFYETGVVPEDLCAKALLWLGDVRKAELTMPIAMRGEYIVVDAAEAGLIASLQRGSALVFAGKGKVEIGIQKVQNRLQLAGDNRPRYGVDPSCVNHINEFESYIRKPGSDTPVKENDHSLDAIRYLLDILEESPPFQFTPVHTVKSENRMVSRHGDLRRVLM